VRPPSKLPEIGGRATTIRGHRVWVSTVLVYLAAGWTTEAVLVEFPALEGDDVRECLAYAAQLADTRFADLDIG
jgi:uncharacterized protein (DUF433 family)